MDIAQLWFKHNKLIKIVGGSAAALVVLSVIATSVVGRTVPTLPDPAVNSAQAIQAWTNPNMGKVPAAKRKHFTRQFCDYYSREENRGQLIDEINTMTDREIYTFQKNISNVAIEMAVDQADEYNALTNANQRRAFIEAKYKEWKQIEKALKAPSGTTISGPGAAAGKTDKAGKRGSLASSKLSQGLPSSPTEIQGRYLRETNPAQRSKLEAFAADMDSYSKEMHTKRKAQSGTPKK